MAETLGQIMEELAKLHDTAAIGGTLDKGEVEFALTIQSEDRGQAFIDALSAVRSAIHACGGHTPRWPELATRSVRVIDDNEGLLLVEA